MEVAVRSTRTRCIPSPRVGIVALLAYNRTLPSLHKCPIRIYTEVIPFGADCSILVYTEGPKFRCLSHPSSTQSWPAGGELSSTYTRKGPPERLPRGQMYARVGPISRARERTFPDREIGKKWVLVASDV